ncbi:MAG: TlyA family RNA methyltransferase [Chloroflexi bacterium]|nr:TlyA family RNA methyltransferase [Chloroflexota bacterium]MQC17146.1 TlyA family RNA methyltransferase [Chloroflexota bacterium]MQC48392.1 TlyA family RNA methyltransferase [Chloroflexota bacterium]
MNQPTEVRHVRPARKQRLDQLMVERGLASGRDRARALIMAREVLLNGQVAMRPAAPVSPDAKIEVKSPPRFVSRGGDKLAHALDHTGIDPAGLRCLDVGASTGGFTDCLLQRGAREVVAVDVAYGKIAQKLRDDPRVEVRERINARELAAIEPAADLLVMDVSFISAATVLRAVMHSVRPGGELLLLVKPQFEAGREQVEKGGVVRDPVVHAACVAMVALAAIDLGLRVRGVVRSPLLGPAGNREFFIRLYRPVTDAGDAE